MVCGGVAVKEYRRSSVISSTTVRVLLHWEEAKSVVDLDFINILMCAINVSVLKKFSGYKK